jgi:uncharacterized Zn-binding protein involved in type VI secretion
MRPVARWPVDKIATGHPCSATANIAGAFQVAVFAGGEPVSCPGDLIAPHTIKVGKFCVPHAAKVNTGSFAVFAFGRPVARIGDSADFGAIITGTPLVLAGG